MLLSELDRFEFLIAVIKESPPLPEKLLSRLRDRNQSFLFLGFDLAQWQLRMLVHVLANNVQREYKSFALELEGGDIDSEARLFYMRGHRLQFVDMDLTEFAAQLSSADGPVAGRDGPAAGRHQRPRPGARGRRAERVRLPRPRGRGRGRTGQRGLRANRFDVWLDKDALEGGDDWDAAIEQRILRDADYVVVLQSANLLRKEVGYVNKEIDLAFDRQQEYRPPRRFIIPTVVDDPANQLVELSNWQFVDLAGPTGSTRSSRRSAATSTGRAERMTDQVVSRRGRAGPTRPPPHRPAAGARSRP